MAGRLTVRTATKADIAAVLELWRTSRNVTASLPDRPEVLQRLIDHTNDALLVAELGGELVGALIAAWDGWRGNMYRLAVRPDHRREGIARQLVKAGEDRLREQGAQRVTALVPRDEGAGGLWSAAEYELDPHMDRFVKNL